MDVGLNELIAAAHRKRDKESRSYNKAQSSFKNDILGNVLRSHPNTVETEQPDRDAKVEKVASIAVTAEGYSEEEYARKSLKITSWLTTMYLITTDVLGPTSAPYAVSKLGYVPGSLIFLLFGVASTYTGYLLWQMFLKLDSDKYPIRSYGDLVGTIYGKYAMYVADIFQVIQLISNVAVVILGSGQGLSQIARGKGCYTVIILCWAILGMLIGQIRSLKKFGFLASFGIWFNILMLVFTIYGVAAFEPNYTAAYKSMQIPRSKKHTVMVYSGPDTFTNHLDGCLNIVYAYGGSLMFMEFMAEMQKPWDFWKSLVCAQSFCFVMYLSFGVIVYSFQGQFTINPAPQGISNYHWQIAAGVISFVAVIICGALYANIGVKATYRLIFQRFFKFPDLESHKYGRLLWMVSVVFYWSLAFVLAAAIPNFTDLVALIGAVCTLQFSYTFPFLLKLGLDLKLASLQLNIEGTRFQRLYKSFMARKWTNLMHTVLFVASFITALLGIVGTAVALSDAFSKGSTTSFTCKSPIA